MNEGYINLARAILTGIVPGEQPFHKQEAYIDLCLMATYSDRDVVDNGVMIHLERGQLLVSVPYLMKRWGWGNTRVRTFLNTLENSGQITLTKQATKQGTKQGSKQTLTLISQGVASFAKQGTKQPSKQATKQGLENGKESSKEKDKDYELKTELRKDLSTPTEYLNPKETDRQLKERFEVLWKLYPRKEGKDLAFRAYKSAVKDGVPDETIREGIERYKAHLAEEGTEIKYTLHGGTWFNQRRWTDEYESKQVPVEPPKQEIRTQVVKTKFSNFDERKIDYDALFANRKNKVGW